MFSNKLRNSRKIHLPVAITIAPSRPGTDASSPQGHCYRLSRLRDAVVARLTGTLLSAVSAQGRSSGSAHRDTAIGLSRLRDAVVARLTGTLLSAVSAQGRSSGSAHRDTAIGLSRLRDAVVARLTGTLLSACLGSGTQ